MTKLSLDIINKYNLKSRLNTPDWDDRGYIFTLPSGIEVSGLFMCNNTPCELDSLEGLDGFIYITTEEQLIEYINLSFSELMDKVASENKNFDKSNYYE